ncbi:LysM peptidoglycan-binding domain-containing protein [Paraburkholderia aspalathi]|nr:MULTISPECIES: FecR domain-containing protein [Paraburkholderia]MBK3786911.1 LysM peptidoglycan-binding domain-containing protein [Paraburkholderia aspalathi]
MPAPATLWAHIALIARIAARPMIAASLLAGTVPCLAAAPGPRPVATVPYVTVSGDTLYAIAARYLRDPRDWAALSRLNRIPAPRRLAAGIGLRLPAARLRQEPESARVIAASGPVEHACGTAPYTPLSSGMILGEGDRVRTGLNGFVTLELTDGSHMTVPQNSLVGIGRLRQTVLTGATDRVIGLQQGEVDSEVTHAAKKDDRFQIRSPSVVAGVRGTRFRVRYGVAEAQTAVEVLDGAVGVDAAAAPAPAPGVPLQASAQLVTANFGSVTRAGGGMDSGIGDPVALLPAPALADPGRTQDGKQVAFDLVPAGAMTGAAGGYRVQVARDADLLDLIRDRHVSAPHADFNDLPDGTYFVRISAIDRNGLEGQSQAYAFERREFDLSAAAEPHAGGRDYTFRWFAGRPGLQTRFRFVLAATPDLRRPLVDQPDLETDQIVVTDLPPGVYYWSVTGEQFDNGRFYEKASAVRSFTVAGQDP